jgi:hypothetical protein
MFEHVVTKKRGSDYIQQHTDCLQRTLVFIWSWSTTQIQTSDLPNTQTPYWLPLPRIVDRRHTQTATKQTQQHSLPGLHKRHLKKLFHSYCRLCKFPDNTSIAFQQVFTKHQTWCCLVSWSLFLIPLQLLCSSS